MHTLDEYEGLGSAPYPYEDQQAPRRSADVVKLNAKTNPRYESFRTHLRSLTDEMMTAPFPPMHEMIVPNFLPHRAVTLFAAEGGTGKSVQLRKLALGFGYWKPGNTWMGEEIAKPKGTGRVLIVTGETNDEMEIGDFRSMYSAERQEEYRKETGSTETKIQVIHASDLGGALFCMRGGQVALTEGGQALYDHIEEWRPEIVIFDTLASLVMEIDLDSSTTQAQGIMNVLKSIAKLGSATIISHHFTKMTDTPSLRAARMQTKGSAGFTDGGRNTINMYAAYAPLELIARNCGINWMTDEIQIVCFGCSKNNIRGMPSGKARVFAQMPMQGLYFSELIEITDHVMRHPYGKDAILGRITVRNKSMSFDDLQAGLDGPAKDKQRGKAAAPARETKVEKAEREKLEQAAADERIIAIMEERGCDAAEASLIYDSYNVSEQEIAKPKGGRPMRGAWVNRDNGDAK